MVFFIQGYHFGSEWRYVTIGLDSGLAPNKRHAVV